MIPEAELRALLAEVDLGYLVEREGGLDAVVDWGGQLSLGAASAPQQRFECYLCKGCSSALGPQLASSAGWQVAACQQSPGSLLPSWCAGFTSPAVRRLLIRWQAHPVWEARDAWKACCSMHRATFGSPATA